MSLATTSAGERNAEATVYVGNIDTLVDEELLWELFLQAGPVASVFLPRDKLSNRHEGFGFVEFKSEEDAKYACLIMNNVKLHERALRVNPSQGDAQMAGFDEGATVYISGLDPVVDERMLHETFSSFGALIATPNILRDDQTGRSKGTALLRYDSFEGAERAIAAMNQQIFVNRTITITFSSKNQISSAQQAQSSV
eukprot:PhM_4_TR1770/c0_g1_i1/m.38944/K12831/SF3B4, SAP49; splicing factor 3B subunit 4